MFKKQFAGSCDSYALAAHRRLHSVYLIPSPNGTTKPQQGAGVGFGRVPAAREFTEHVRSSKLLTGWGDLGLGLGTAANPQKNITFFKRHDFDRFPET